MPLVEDVASCAAVPWTPTCSEQEINVVGSAVVPWTRTYYDELDAVESVVVPWTPSHYEELDADAVGSAVIPWMQMAPVLAHSDQDGSSVVSFQLSSLDQPTNAWLAIVGLGTAVLLVGVIGYWTCHHFSPSPSAAEKKLDELKALMAGKDQEIAQKNAVISDLQWQVKHLPTTRAEF